MEINAGCCRICGRPVPGKKWYCKSCREKMKEKRQQEKKAEEVVLVCKKCRKMFVGSVRPDRHPADYCPACRKALYADPNDNGFRQAVGRTKSGRKHREPKDRDSINHVVWEIEIINQQRRAAGGQTLTYGTYVPQREKLAKEYQEARRLAGFGPEPEHHSKRKK